MATPGLRETKKAARDVFDGGRMKKQKAARDRFDSGRQKAARDMRSDGPSRGTWIAA